ncbi:hypothetical protein OAE26_01910 [Synechococcus sp. AH-551-E05]|nr:hypothetical protein [Synechococcus sp. AH-551-E05]MDB4651315.1 hypothetical protein [Synechococcus sp. AH-551-E05]
MTSSSEQTGEFSKIDHHSLDQLASSTGSDIAKSSSANPLTKFEGAKDLVEGVRTLVQKNTFHLSLTQRTPEATLFSEETDSLWGNRVGVHFKMERRVEGLPSICINQIQHSGTLFLNSRFQMLGYNRCWLVDGPWFAMHRFNDFCAGSQFAQTDLLPNAYNLSAAMQLLTETKFWLHFRDPRSVVVSAPHLMDRSYLGKKRPWLTPEYIYMESLKHTDSSRYPDSIIPVDYHSWSFDRRLDFFIKGRFQRLADFVNGWLDFYLNLPVDLRRKVHLTEFNRDLRGKDAQFLAKALEFTKVHKIMSKNPQARDVPRGFFDPSQGNTHWRKGLPDEWKTACTTDQIEWMNSFIDDKVFDFFGWERF